MVAQNGGTKTTAFRGFELSHFARVVEYVDGSLWHEIAPAGRHTVPRPLGQPGKPDPQCLVDAVVVEPIDPLVHDHIRTRPGAETFPEHVDLRSLILRHPRQAISDAPQQRSELLAAKGHFLHRQERGKPAVLDHTGCDVPPGEELGALNHRLVYPTGPGWRHEEKMRPLEGAGALQLAHGELGAAHGIDGLGVVSDVDADRWGYGRLTHDLLDQCPGGDVGHVAASLQAEITERRDALLATRNERRHRRHGIGRLYVFVGSPDIADPCVVRGHRAGRPQRSVGDAPDHPFGRARAQVAHQGFS